LETYSRYQEFTVRNRGEMNAREEIVAAMNTTKPLTSITMYNTGLDIIFDSKGM